MNINVFKSHAELDAKACELVKAVIQSKPQVTLGLATGSSPVGMYARLVDQVKRGQLSFKHVTTFNLDEYVGLPDNHPQSYLTFMNQHLFNHVDIDRKNIHMPSAQGHDLEANAKAYHDALWANHVDLQVLGVGSNGHIGFNEPGTPVDSTVHVVRMHKQTRLDNARFFASLDEVPEYAISMGISDILRAKKIVLIATGLKKAKAIRELVSGKITVDVPCTILQTHPDVTLLLDEEAASLLS
jgi:glucosamine-6-phosphate deaminase